MNKAMLWVALTGLVFVSGYLGYRLHHYRQAEIVHPPAQQDAVATPIVGRHRPAFTLPDLDGQLRAVTEWDGKVLALNFWATWCPPCIKEVPEFVALQEEYQAQGLQFVGIALQQPDAVRAFVAEHKVNYPILAGEQEVIELAAAYGNHLGALPYTVIIDRSGQVAHVKPGILAAEEAKRVISSLL